MSDYYDDYVDARQEAFHLECRLEDAEAYIEFLQSTLESMSAVISHTWASGGISQFKNGDAAGSFRAIVRVSHIYDSCDWVRIRESWEKES